MDVPEESWISEQFERLDQLRASSPHMRKLFEQIGRSNAEIADEMNYSQRQVRRYLGKVYAFLGIPGSRRTVRGKLAKLVGQWDQARGRGGSSHPADPNSEPEDPIAEESRPMR